MKKRMVYVEDDEDDFFLLQKAFQDVDKDLELINITNGFDTIKYLKQADETSYPSLIIMDLNMPVMDGRETLELLKKDDKLKNIPVIFFSTSASPADKKSIENADTELIIKPSLYENLQAIAKRLAGLYSLLNFCSVIT